MWFLLFAFIGCGSSNEGAPASPVAGASVPSAPHPSASGADATGTPAPTPAPAGVEAKVDLDAGKDWGAVFWREERAWRAGSGGEALIGPELSTTGRAGAESGACGVALEGATKGAVLAIPAGRTATTPPAAPATRAEVVERAAWRLDEVLPPRDRFSPAISSPDPALQRGVRVASVSKTRRTGAPPVLLSSGARDCVGAIAALNADAGKVLAWDRIPEVCEPLALVPAADYDGDGRRELVAWNQTRVVLYAIDEAPGQLRLTRIGDWRCP